MRRYVQAHWCVVLAAVMWLSPVAALRAQLPEATGNPGVDTRFVTPQTVAVVFVQPARVMNSPAGEMLPREVATAAGLKHVGIDPATVESIQIVVEPPMGPTMFAAAIAKTSVPIDLDQVMGKLPPPLVAQLEQTQAGGRPYYKGTQPNMPCIYLPDDNTLVVATEPMLKKLFNKSSRSSQTGLILDRLTNDPVDDDAFAMVNIEFLRPLIAMGLSQAPPDVPPAARTLFEAPDLTRDIELSLNITGQGPSKLLIHANDAEDAQKLVGLVATARQMAQGEQDVEIARLKSSGDEVEAAFGSYLERMQAKMNQLEPVVSDDTLTVFEADASNQNPAVLAAVMGVLVALLLPAVQAAREAARRNVSMNNLKQIILAMHIYHDAKKSLPPHAIYSDDGQPLLSWRVAILPYIEEQALYNEFHLDEPWNSPHNMKLIPRMPKMYIDASSSLDPAAGKTSYLAVSGEGTVFPNQQEGLDFAEMPDGTASTVAIVQVDDSIAVPWTQPADYVPDDANLLNGLGGLHPGIFLAAFCDGHVSAVANSIDPQQWKALTTRDGGEVVNQQ